MFEYDWSYRIYMQYHLPYVVINTCHIFGHEMRDGWFGLAYSLVMGNNLTIDSG